MEHSPRRVVARCNGNGPSPHACPAPECPFVRRVTRQLTSGFGAASPLSFHCCISALRLRALPYEDLFAVGTWIAMRFCCNRSLLAGKGPRSDTRVDMLARGGWLAGARDASSLGSRRPRCNWLFPARTSNMKQRLGIIADDLTGANDTGVQFAKRGLATTVLLDIITSPQRVVSDADVIVINTDSRWSDPGAAYSRVKAAAEVLKDAGVVTVYKKIDSALRGNVGAELDAVMDAFDAKVAFVAPAFPDAGRVTLGGKQLLKDKPLDKSEMARDPLSPITESYVPALVKRQSRRNVGHVPLEEVNSGQDGLLVSFSTRIRSGDEIIVIDAAEREHLHTIARAIASLDLPLVIAGSAGLAAELPEVLSIVSSSDRGADERCANGVLVVCGSASPTASGQLDYATAALDMRSISVDASDILSGLGLSKDRVGSIVSEASETLAQGRDVLIRLNSDSCPRGPVPTDSRDVSGSSVSPGSPHIDAGADESSLRREYPFNRGESWGVREDDIEKRVEDSRRITGFLALLAKEILARCKVTGLVLTGGDTALAVCRILEASAVALLDEIVPGVPSGRLVDGPHSGLVIVTKAGSFGGVDVFVKIIGYLHGTVLKRRLASSAVGSNGHVVGRPSG